MKSESTRHCRLYIKIAVTTVVTGGAVADLARVVASGALTETVTQVAPGQQ